MRYSSQLTSLFADAVSAHDIVDAYAVKFLFVLLMFLGILEAVEVAQAVILTLLGRMEQKVRRSRRGFERLIRALARIAAAARPQPDEWMKTNVRERHEGIGKPGGDA